MNETSRVEQIEKEIKKESQKKKKKKKRIQTITALSCPAQGINRGTIEPHCSGRLPAKQKKMELKPKLNLKLKIHRFFFDAKLQTVNIIPISIYV